MLVHLWMISIDVQNGTSYHFTNVAAVGGGPVFTQDTRHTQDSRHTQDTRQQTFTKRTILSMSAHGYLVCSAGVVNPR